MSEEPGGECNLNVPVGSCSVEEHQSVLLRVCFPPSVQVEVSPGPCLTPSWPSPSSSPAAATPTWSTASSTGWRLSQVRSSGGNNPAAACRLASHLFFISSSVSNESQHWFTYLHHSNVLYLPRVQVWRAASCCSRRSSLSSPERARWGGRSGPAGSRRSHSCRGDQTIQKSGRIQTSWSLFLFVPPGAPERSAHAHHRNQL